MLESGRALGCRPQAAALVALLADPCRGWDAIVVGEYERAFYGSQYAAMAPLFDHYGVQLWMPEVGGRVDFASEHDEQAMTMLGLSSKREAQCRQDRAGAERSRSAVPVGIRPGPEPAPPRYQVDAGRHVRRAHFAAAGRQHAKRRPPPELTGSGSEDREATVRSG